MFETPTCNLRCMLYINNECDFMVMGGVRRYQEVRWTGMLVPAEKLTGEALGHRDHNKTLTRPAKYKEEEEAKKRMMCELLKLLVMK